MVEGGGTVIWSFIKNGLVDDLYVYVAPIVVGGKNTPTIADGDGVKSLDELKHLKIINVSKLGQGVVIHYRLII